MSLDYDRPVCLIVSFCWPCGDDHEIEVEAAGWEPGTETDQRLGHGCRCLNTGRLFLGLYLPGELAALVRGWRAASA